MNAYKWVIVVIMAMLHGCDSSGNRDVAINGEAYRIPKQNITVVAGDEPEHLDQGFDRSNLVLGLVWKREVLAKAIHGFTFRVDEEMRSNVYARIYYPAGEGLSKGSSLIDALLLSGRYSSAVVTYDKELNLYKVSRSNDRCHQLFFMEPGKGAQVPDRISSFWAGKICEEPSSDITSHITHYHKGMYFEIKIGGPNFHLRDEIKKFVVSQLEGWRVQK